MEMSGQRKLPVARKVAWDALQDPQKIRAAIPGCESIERTPEGYTVVMKATLGPVSAKFKGKLWLENVVEPESYTLNFSGDGVAAGFANGAAKVKLAEDAGTTMLDYAVKANIGGKLAQIGSRLVDSAARKIADQFFENFERELAGG
jgi:carbon monoxide dehydrogenase subunit G